MVTTTVFVVSPDFPRDEHLSLLGGEYDDSVATARRLGYDGIELVAGDPDAVDADALEATLQKHGMLISAINSGGLSYVLKVSLVNGNRRKEDLAFRKLGTLIRLARRFRCLVQVGVSRGEALQGRPADYFRDRLVEVMKRVCDAALEQQVGIIFEYTCHLEINTINTLSEALGVIERVAKPNLGLLLDTYHSSVDDPNVYDALQKTRGILKHVHLHDSDRGPAGASNGTLDFDRIIRILGDIGYCGALSDGLLTLSLPEDQIRRSTCFLRETLRKYGLRNGENLWSEPTLARTRTD
jgi:D-psicose/D-tagatose/L-ribulose 3-epimerase